MLHSVIAVVDVGLYLLASILLAKQIHAKNQQTLSKAFVASLLLAVIMHGATMHFSLFKDGLFHLNFFNVSPLILFVVVAVLLPPLFKRVPVDSILLTALPLAALSVAVAAWAPKQTVKVISDVGVISHLVLSIAAYSLMMIAALQAVMLSLQEHALKDHQLRRMIKFLPPLQAMEALLFQVLIVGFALLSAAILSGFVFLEDMFAQHLAHKTILSIIAWVVFAILIYGRLARGWRGKTAAYWTLTGFAILMLAYFGSKFVLEIVL